MHSCSIYCKELTSYSTFGDLGKLLTMRIYLKLKPLDMVPVSAYSLWFQEKVCTKIKLDFGNMFLLVS